LLEENLKTGGNITQHLLEFTCFQTLCLIAQERPNSIDYVEKFVFLKKSFFNFESEYILGIEKEISK
jgi:hypothetical protein